MFIVTLSLSLMEDINYSNKKEKNLEFDLGKSNETEQIIEVKNPNSSLLRQVSLEARITDNNGKNYFRISKLADSSCSKCFS